MAERGTAPALPCRMNRLLVGLLSFAVLIVMTTCRDDQSFRVPTAVSGPPAADLAAGTGPVTLVGAGNIAKCGQVGAAATANLLDAIPGTVFAAGVDVVVNAHYGFYERFAPQTPAGVADPAGGIREFVAGTGGALVTSFGTVRPNSQVRNSGTFGVLNLTLGDGSYSWQFVPVAGKTFTDSGTTACHGARPTVNAGTDITTNPGDTVTLSPASTIPVP